MKLQELIDWTISTLDWADRQIKHIEEKDPWGKGARATKEYWEGVKQGAHTMAGHLLYGVEDLSDIKIRPANKREKQVFSYEYKHEDGTVETIKPSGILMFNHKKYPTFFDDYGQCEFIRINGENYTGGTYNMWPEGEFLYVLMEHLGK